MLDRAARAKQPDRQPDPVAIGAKRSDSRTPTLPRRSPPASSRRGGSIPPALDESPRRNRPASRTTIRPQTAGPPDAARAVRPPRRSPDRAVAKAADRSGPRGSPAAARRVVRSSECRRSPESFTMSAGNRSGGDRASGAPRSRDDAIASARRNDIGEHGAPRARWPAKHELPSLRHVRQKWAAAQAAPSVSAMAARIAKPRWRNSCTTRPASAPSPPNNGPIPLTSRANPSGRSPELDHHRRAESLAPEGQYRPARSASGSAAEVSGGRRQGTGD